jgi:acyl dehydratase
MPGKPFDQWAVGETIAHSLTRTVTETDNLLTCALTHNPQPLHLDAEYAAGTEFGRIVVNGIYTFGLMVHPKPVFVGDTLHFETSVLEKRESKSRPTAGLVVFEHRAINQRGEVVCQCKRTAMLHKSAV